MKTKTLPLTLLCFCAAIFYNHFASAQGTLTPPGPPGPTMKTLSQVEPRTPISSLPFTISTPGSYYLTTNLTGVSGQNGLTVVAANVTIDLRGFSLVGVSGSENAIGCGTVSNLIVQNGNVSGWGLDGIYATEVQNGQFNNLVLTGNAFHGTELGNNMQISRCTASQNGRNGFSGSAGSCTYENCIANQNKQYGFYTGDECQLLDCTANYNTFDGFIPYYNCTLRDCTADYNGGDGFNAAEGCKAINCTANDNSSQGLHLGDSSVARGCNASYNTSTGISTGNSTAIESCTASYNGSAGITTGNNCLIKSSTASSNTGQGISAGNACALAGCTANANQTNNISAGSGCELNQCTANNSVTGHGFTLANADNIIACTAYANGSNGIDASDRTMVLDCNASFNSNAGIHLIYLGSVKQCNCLNNGFYGILLDNNSFATVLNNTCSYNGLTSFSGVPAKGAGIYVTNSGGCRIEGNTLNYNYLGVLVASNNNAIIIHNSAAHSESTAFSLGTGNSWGPIVNVSGVGDMSGVANANNPQANFIH